MDQVFRSVGASHDDHDGRSCEGEKGANPRPWTRNVPIALSIALVALLGSAGALSAPAGVVTAQLESPTDQTAPSSPIDCGGVSVQGPNPPTDPAAAQVERCFADAFASCAPAGLTFTMRGVDSRTTISLSTQSANPCQILVASDTVILPRLRQSLSFVCTTLNQDQTGLVISSCGDQADLTVPGP
jgi:hypothetical protein